MGLDPSEIRRSYDRVAEQYAAAFADELDAKPLDRALLSVVADDVRQRAAGPLADLGSGPGHIGAFVAARGAPAVALDLAPAMAAVARHEMGVPATAGSLTDLPFTDHSLGGAVAFYCLIHLDDAGLDAAAAELARAIAPGGPLLVAFHTGTEVRHLDTWYDQPVDLDFRFYEPVTVTSRLEDAGFAIEATFDRAPHPHESTRRTYLLARCLPPA
jgi:SAM-dependent methyltransferase